MLVEVQQRLIAAAAVMAAVRYFVTMDASVLLSSAQLIVWHRILARIQPANGIAL